MIFDKDDSPLYSYDTAYAPKDDWCLDQDVLRNPDPVGWTLSISEMVQNVHCWHCNSWDCSGDYAVHRHRSDHKISRKRHRVDAYHDHVNL